MSLIFLDAHLCPDCGAVLRWLKVYQAALLRACGYGATERLTLRSCPDCGWAFVHEKTEMRPTQSDGGSDAPGA